MNKGTAMKRILRIQQSKNRKEKQSSSTTVVQIEGGQIGKERAEQQYNRGVRADGETT